METTVKTCLLCKRELPATTEFFHKAPHDYMGFHRHCKECRNARRREQTITDAEYAMKNRERAARWRDANPELSREKARRYAAEHRSDAVERVRQWRMANPEKYREACTYASRRDHFRSNRDYYTAVKHNFRARSEGVDGTIAGDDISGLYIEQSGLCSYCGEDMGETYTVDHVLPLSRGGTNTPDNIVLCCGVCNSSKGTATLDEWEARKS